ncbi:DoxX family protein [Salmonella bongori]|uniref:Inner membrane protein YqjF n=3 Tax=Salmonella bongori TaxID=54736 RepID=S5NCV3_SALBN|nr:Inner membrane protein YqjF [Salmonella bongori N268-08]ECC8731215.1 DoxX family protein [Salmonella bongori]EGE4653489.1 DoxX family protein [Salmonella bongori serovar 40:z35:- str. 95-0123]EGE4659412.1 DoxX family protein [Salmonella bongori serovar 48:i:- str. 94-0708]TNB51730.1 DoxX family protein [Salmonella bongori serovar 48:z35:-]
MILLIDNSEASCRAIAYEKNVSSRSGRLENKMKKLEDVGVLIARILMPVLFITAGWGKINAYTGTQQYMEAMGVPGFLLPLTILLEFGGGLAILLGFFTRTTALFTAGFTLLTAFIFHSNFAEGVNSLMFMKNLTMAGGFLLLALTGPGTFSLDRLLNKKW